jgi:hypothetical protein
VEEHNLEDLQSKASQSPLSDLIEPVGSKSQYVSARRAQRTYISRKVSGMNEDSGPKEKLDLSRS